MSIDPPDDFNDSDKGQLPLERVRQEMERWLDVARSTGERALESLGVVSAGRALLPAVDVVESATEVTVLVDLPGVAAENVNLTLVGSVLSIKATRQSLNVPETTRRHLIERSSAPFERSIGLPSSVDLEGVHAETRDGLLTVTLRKPAIMHGRSIPVVRSAQASQ